MAWLYVPESAGLKSDSALQWADGTVAFVTSSGTPTPRPCSWRGWKTRPWIRRLYGMTLKPSTAQRGVELWISSLAATRASRSASPENDLANAIRATCGRTYDGLLAKYAPARASSRMYQDTFDWATPTLEETSESLATELRREYSARRNAARRIAGSGSSSSQWPTAQARDEKNPSDQNSGRAQRKAAQGWTVDLNDYAANWATPQAADCGKAFIASKNGRVLVREAETWQTSATDSFRSRGGDRKQEQGLDQQARLFPTPSARDWKSGEASAATRAKNARPLNEVVENAVYRGHQDQLTQTPGRACSQCGRTLRRRLNPAFVEWLMGLPLGWSSAATDCDALAMESFRSWRRRLSCVWPRVLDWEK